MREIPIAFHPCYCHPLPEEHRFPMVKYELIPEQLLYEGTISKDDFFAPGIAIDTAVLRAHTEPYLTRLKLQQLSPAEQRRIGFPQSPLLTERELTITQGTIECCRYATEYGISLNIAGGTHHAFSDRGEGFCLLNDFAVAAHELLFSGRYERILIIDLDVHQGNGTASIFQHEPGVFTFSMHGKNNYPFRKEISDLDVALEDGTGDTEYLQLLSTHLQALIQKVKPQFAFYLSGVDVLETDRFGKLKLTIDGCRQRDEKVFSILHASNIPCTVAMGGGYSPQIKTIVEAHCNTFRVAKKIYS